MLSGKKYIFGNVLFLYGNCKFIKGGRFYFFYVINIGNCCRIIYFEFNMNIKFICYKNL